MTIRRSKTPKRSPARAPRPTSPLVPLTPAEEQTVNGLAAAALQSVETAIANDPAARVIEQIHQERELHRGNVGVKAVREQAPEQTLQFLERQLDSAKEGAVGDFADPRSFRDALIRLAARCIDGAIACDRFLAAQGDQA